MLEKRNHFKWNKIEYGLSNFELTYFITQKKNKETKYYYIYDFFNHRFEISVEMLALTDKSRETLFYYVDEFLLSFKPENKFFLKRQFLFMYLKFFSNSYQGYRHFLKLPARGNRTWSNRKSQIKVNDGFLKYYRNIFFKKNGSYCFESKKFILLYAEFINKFYYVNFFKMWRHARNRRREYIGKNFFRPWRYDIRSILANRVYIFLEKTEKLKKNKKRKQRKKIKIPNNYFNIGFNKNFTKYMMRRVLRFWNNDPLHKPKRKQVKKKKK